MSALGASLSNLLKEPEYADSRSRSYINFPIHDHRRNEFVTRSEMIAPVRCLIAVVEFGCKIPGVVSVQNRSVGVLGGPENRIAGSVGRNAGSRSRIRKDVRGQRCRRTPQLGAADGKPPPAVLSCPVI